MRSFWMRNTVLALAALGLCTLGSTAQADNYSAYFEADARTLFEEQSRRLDELEAELASLRRRNGPDGDAAAVAAHSCCTKSCCKPCCPPVRCKQCCGLVAGFEATVLEVHQGGVVVPQVPVNTSPDAYDYEFAPRFWLGFEVSNGFGMRARYWDYNHGAASSTAVVDQTFSLEARTLDLEATQGASLCGWQFEFAGGVRWGAMMDELNITSIPASGMVMRDFDGVGPTFALGVRRPLGSGALAMVANLRGSLLFGDTEVDATGPLGLVGTDLDVEDHLMQIWEIQVGGEFATQLGGGRFFARAVLEAQVWEWGSSVAGTLGSDVGFVGPSFSVGLDR